MAIRLGNPLKIGPKVCLTNLKKKLNRVWKLKEEEIKITKSCLFYDSFATIMRGVNWIMSVRQLVQRTEEEKMFLKACKCLQSDAWPAYIFFTFIFKKKKPEGWFKHLTFDKQNLKQDIYRTSDQCKLFLVKKKALTICNTKEGKVGDCSNHRLLLHGYAIPEGIENVLSTLLHIKIKQHK